MSNPQIEISKNMAFREDVMLKLNQLDIKIETLSKLIKGLKTQQSNKGKAKTNPTNED